MQINKAELARRLNSQKNIINKFQSTLNQTPNINNTKPVSSNSELPMPNLYDEDTGKVVEINKAPVQIKSDILNTIIGSLAKQGESITNIAKEFDVSKDQISAARSQANGSPQVEASIGRIKELALDKLMMSLKLMTEDKFDNADLKTLSNTAANMSRVVEKLSPKESNGGMSQLIIYAPKLRQESGYKIIDV